MIQAATLTNTQAATLAPKLQPYAPRLRPLASRRVDWARRAMTRRAVRPCAWRHSSDLKQAQPYRAAWERRATRGCRCVCRGTEPKPKLARKSKPSPLSPPATSFQSDDRAEL